MNFSLLMLVVTMGATLAFNALKTSNRFQTTIRALDDATIQKLEDLRASRGQVTNSEGIVDASNDVVGVYDTYKEIKAMMKKLRNIIKNEQSEKRKTKELKSFCELFEQSLKFEEILKKKLGLPSVAPTAISEIAALETIDNEIAALQKQLEEVAVVIPEGKRVGEERFAY